jgi:transcriptional regulator with XRE-family HTH domain
MMYDFGELLKQLRKEKGYSQEQLAQKINKSKSLISKYENNQKLPTLETLIDLSVLFDVSLDFLAQIPRIKSSYLPMP